MENLVSIVMPTYNAVLYIKDAIDSVRNQTYSEWELLIVDDCSTDNTEEVVKTYLRDSRIHYLKNSENRGAAVSRNKALKAAKGKWVAFLDSDDIWMPDKLEKQIRFMKENGYLFSYTQYEEINEIGYPLGVKVSGPKKISRLGMYAYCWPGCLTVMYDREAIGEIQIKDIKKNNDYAMWLKICRKADCYLYPKVMAKYRKRGGSISRLKYSKLVKWHYRLWHGAEERNSICALVFTVLNLLFGIYKKIVFVERGRDMKYWKSRRNTA